MLIVSAARRVANAGRRGVRGQSGGGGAAAGDAGARATTYPRHPPTLPTHPYPHGYPPTHPPPTQVLVLPAGETATVKARADFSLLSALSSLASPRALQ